MTKTTKRATVKQLEEALPEILKQHENDLIHETRAGRVVAAMQAPGTDVDADGAFTWMFSSIGVDEFAQSGPAGFRADFTRAREANGYPIILIGSDGMTMVVLHKGEQPWSN